MRDGKVFEERQAFAPFVYGLTLLCIAMMFLPPHHWPLILPFMVLMVLVLNLLSMRTEVTSEGVRVRFGYFVPLYVRTIRLEDIDTVEAVTYRPIADYGGWGIRGLPGRIALNARGDRGVLLTLLRGGTVLIGSQRPEELAASIMEARS